MRSVLSLLFILFLFSFSTEAKECYGNADCDPGYRCLVRSIDSPYQCIKNPQHEVCHSISNFDSGSSPIPSGGTQDLNLENNKRIVIEFYDLAFNKHKAIEAANKYLAKDYIQHNPNVADGRDGFLEAFSGQSQAETSTSCFKRIIAQGDLVVVHSHGKHLPEDRGVAVVDIFRLKNGIIVEHWDVGQKVPETSKNNNTMF